MVGALSVEDVTFFAFVILGIVLLLFAVFIIGLWINRHQVGRSPYTGLPLRRGDDLPFGTVEKVLLYMYSIQEYDNRLFDFRYATVCRQTGRIFPNSIGWFGVIQLDWSFLKKRYPGNYLSWGSLPVELQEEIRREHESLEGFQTEYSCPNPSPREITREYIFLKPGPLYVDIHTKALLGWKLVPDTELEVLLVQKPKQRPPIRLIDDKESDQ